MISELFIPQKNYKTNDFNEIQKFLSGYGVEFTRWQAHQTLSVDDSQEKILLAYDHELKPFMAKKGFQSADVINVSPQTPEVKSLREKFIKEHTHSEDEVRFFVDGSGLFWFHFNDGAIVRIQCVKGDFLSVPQGTKHWFDLEPHYFVKAIRIFSNKEGWIANYTGSGVDNQFKDLQ